MILTEKDTLSNRYIRRQINTYKKKKAALVNSTKPIKGVKSRKLFNTLLNIVLKIKSFIVGLKYEFIKKTNVKEQDTAVIYAITHIGKYDLEMIWEACKMFGYVFAGDWELMYATVDDYFMRAKGVIWVDTSDKEDRKNSYKFMVKALKQGIPVIIFPEGIWNLTENLPMMKLFPGAVQAAKEASVPIIPIAIEQRGKQFTLNMGEELYFDDIEETKAVEILRDTMATLKWGIWENYGLEKRADIPCGYYEAFLNERFAECKGVDMELINSRMYRDKDDREYIAVMIDIKKLKENKI